MNKEPYIDPRVLCVKEKQTQEEMKDSAVQIRKILSNTPCADKKYDLFLKQYQNERAS